MFFTLQGEDYHNTFPRGEALGYELLPPSGRAISINLKVGFSQNGVLIRPPTLVGDWVGGRGKKGECLGGPMGGGSGILMLTF